MKRIRRKWANALPLILFFSLAVTVATAIFVYRHVPDLYSAQFRFFALPAGVQTEKNGGELTRMLAKDLDEMLSTPDFQNAVIQKAVSDGKTRLYVRGSGASHTIRLTAWGFDPEVTGSLANAAGDLLVERAASVLKATDVSVMVRAEQPAAELEHFRVLCVIAAFIGSFLVFSLPGMLFGSTSRKLRFGKSTEDIPLPCLGGMTRFDRALRLQAKSGGRDNPAPPLYDLIDEGNLSRTKELAARLKSMQLRKGCSLTVTGMETDGDSAAVTALLASELAVQGYSVLVIEMDSYRPGLGSIFRRAGTLDVLDCMEKEDALSEAVLTTEIPGLFFIDACHSPGFVSQIAGTEAFASFLEDAQQTFHYVLLHAPASSRWVDASLLGRLTELVLLVADDGKHSAAKLEAEARKLGRCVRQVAGYVLCDVPGRRINRREYVALPVYG